MAAISTFKRHRKTCLCLPHVTQKQTLEINPLEFSFLNNDSGNKLTFFFAFGGNCSGNFFPIDSFKEEK